MLVTRVGDNTVDNNSRVSCCTLEVKAKGSNGSPGTRKAETKGMGGSGSWALGDTMTAGFHFAVVSNAERLQSSTIIVP